MVPLQAPLREGSPGAEIFANIYLSQSDVLAVIRRTATGRLSNRDPVTPKFQLGLS